jgi:hypothetical protein
LHIPSKGRLDIGEEALAYHSRTVFRGIDIAKNAMRGYGQITNAAAAGEDLRRKARKLLIQSSPGRCNLSLNKGGEAFQRFQTFGNGHGQRVAVQMKARCYPKMLFSHEPVLIPHAGLPPGKQ